MASKGRRFDNATVREGLEWLSRNGWEVTYRPLAEARRTYSPPPPIWMNEDDLLDVVHETLQSVATAKREERKAKLPFDASVCSFSESVIDLDTYSSVMETEDLENAF